MNLERVQQMIDDVHVAFKTLRAFRELGFGGLITDGLKRTVMAAAILLLQYVYLVRENLELRQELQKTKDRSDRMEAVIDRMSVSWDDLGIDEIDKDTGKPLCEPDAWSEEEEEFFAFVKKVLDTEATM